MFSSLFAETSLRCFALKQPETNPKHENKPCIPHLWNYTIREIIETQHWKSNFLKVKSEKTFQKKTNAVPSRAPVARENVRTPAWAIFGSANLSNSIGIGDQRHDVESSIVFVGDVIARTFWLVKTTPFFLQKKYQQIQLVVKTHPLLPWSCGNCDIYWRFIAASRRPYTRQNSRGTYKSANWNGK